MKKAPIMRPFNVVLLESFNPEMQEKIRTLAGNKLNLIFPKDSSQTSLNAVLDEAEAVVVRAIKIQPQWLENMPKLKIIHQWGTGTDGIPIAEAQKRGIIIARSPGRNAPSVADLTIGLMLACRRRICVADARIRQGLWLEPNLYDIGRDLTGARVGLVGFGAIGQLVAKRLTGFDCEVFYTQRKGRIDHPATFLPLDELVKKVDIISLHLPLRPETRHLFDAARLAEMRKNAVIINTSRGGLIDEAALSTALHSGHLASAGLDVFSSEPLAQDAVIRQAPNTVLTTHCGGGTADNLARLVTHWSENMRLFAEGQPLNPADIVTL